MDMLRRLTNCRIIIIIIIIIISKLMFKQVKMQPLPINILPLHHTDMVLSLSISTAIFQMDLG